MAKVLYFVFFVFLQILGATTGCLGEHFPFAPILLAMDCVRPPVEWHPVTEWEVFDVFQKLYEQQCKSLSLRQSQRLRSSEVSQRWRALLEHCNSTNTSTTAAPGSLLVFETDQPGSDLAGTCDDDIASPTIAGGGVHAGQTTVKPSIRSGKKQIPLFSDSVRAGTAETCGEAEAPVPVEPTLCAFCHRGEDRLAEQVDALSSHFLVDFGMLGPYTIPRVKQPQYAHYECAYWAPKVAMAECEGRRTEGALPELLGVEQEIGRAKRLVGTPHAPAPALASGSADEMMQGMSCARFLAVLCVLRCPRMME